MDNKRDAKWDNVKLILIILVVVGHVADYYMSKSTIMYIIRFYIYIFHMPAFLFVSGLFSKRVVREKSWRDISKYLLFYFVLKVIKFIYAKIAGENMTFKLFYESGSPWFVLALFFMFIITFYAKNFSPVYFMPLLVILSILAGYTTSNTQFLAFLRVINFYPFFYLGYLFDKKEILKYTEKKQCKIVAGSMLILIFLFCTSFINKLKPFKLLLSGQHSYYKLSKFQEYGGLLRLMLMVLSTVMVFCLIAIVPKKRTFFTKYGERTLAIYMTHQFFLHIIFAKTNCGVLLASNHPIFGAAILLGFGVILTFLCGNKYFHRIFTSH